MGIFNKTEAEKKIEEEKRKINNLRTYINNSTLSEDNKIFLLKYLNDSINNTNGKENDFFDLDFLLRVLYQINQNEYANGMSLKTYLDKVKNCVHDLLPFGNKTANYEEIKELILDNFIGTYGYINQGIYNKDIYNMIGNIYYFTRVMKSIDKNERIKTKLPLLVNYMNHSHKYITDTADYTNDLLSVINSFDSSVLDDQKYFEDALKTAEKVSGITDISHEDIITAQRTIHLLNSKIEEISLLVDRLDMKQSEAKKTASESILKVVSASDDSIRQLKNQTETLKQNLKIFADGLTSGLSNRVDNLFLESQQKYQKDSLDFLESTKEMIQESEKELRRLTKKIEESLKIIQDFAENEPALQNYLEKAEESSEIRDTLLKLIREEKDTLGKINSRKEGKIVEGIENIVVPTTKKVELPETIVIPKNIQIIPWYAYKTEKEYQERLKRIKDKMEKNISNGIIYHEKTLEIIECLLVGDWPYIYGPSGAGKGYIVKQIGELLDQPVVDGGKIGEVHTVLGYIDAQGRFRAPAALSACVDGKIIFFDEFDNGNSDTRVALNTMYTNLRDKILDPSSEQYIRFANEFDVPINPNMRMIAAGNTNGTGSDENYTDRYATDESIKERYKVIYIPYDNRVEERILDKYKNWYRFFIVFRGACDNYASTHGLLSAPGNASTRDASDILRDVTLNAKTLDEMVCQYFVQIKDEDYRNYIGDIIASKYHINRDQSRYRNYDGTLGSVDEETIARQFIKRCNVGIEGSYE